MATVELRLQPITVPNFILLDPPTFSSIALEKLPDETITTLIQEFSDNVWKKVTAARSRR